MARESLPQIHSNLTQEPFPPLESGDHLTRSEFERRLLNRKQVDRFN